MAVSYERGTPVRPHRQSDLIEGRGSKADWPAQFLPPKLPSLLPGASVNRNHLEFEPFFVIRGKSPSSLPRFQSEVQEYLAHEKTPNPFGPP